MPVTHITRNAWIDATIDATESRTTTVDNTGQARVFDAVDAASFAVAAVPDRVANAMRDSALRMQEHIDNHFAAALFGPIGGLVGDLARDVVRVRPPAPFIPPPAPPAPVATLGGRRSIAFTDEE